MLSKMELKLTSVSDLMSLSDIFLKSGLFVGCKSASQAAVKIMAGAELGIGPFASMDGFDTIQGRPAMSGGLMAAMVKRSEAYDYRVIKIEDNECVIEFFERGKSIGVSKFTSKDAQAAQVSGKNNWKQYPRNMLFNRAISNGIRWYCPDLFLGVKVYTPEELGKDEAIKEVVSENVPDVSVIDAPKKEVQRTEAQNLNYCSFIERMGIVNSLDMLQVLAKNIGNADLLEADTKSLRADFRAKKAELVEAKKVSDEEVIDIPHFEEGKDAPWED